MTKSVQSFFFLAALYSTSASAGTYTIDLSFATGPGQPTRVVLTDKYCISQIPDVIGLDRGQAEFKIVTKSGFFSKCGWVHSSATFVVQNNNSEKKLEFEFYNEVGYQPTLKIKWPSTANCTLSYDYIQCGTL